MSPLDKITVGMTAEKRLIVSPEMTVGHVVPGMPAVFGTPIMILHMDGMGIPDRLVIASRLRIRRTGREISDVTFLDVGDISAAPRIENGDAGNAVGHDRPFPSLVPMQLTGPAGRKPHVDARVSFKMAKSSTVT